MTSMTRRHMLALAGASAAAAILGACGGASRSTSAPFGTRTTSASVPAGSAATAQGKRGGTLRIGQQFDIQPARLHAITFQHYAVIYAVFDTLVRLDATNNPQPELAESWQFSPDFKTLTLKLRRDVKFHTGRAMTADDVIWNLKRVQDPKASSQNANLAKAIESMAAPDPATLEIKFIAPRPAVFDMLDALWILDPQSLADAEGGKRWVGTGPFMWQEWKPGVELTLKRFDGYWKPNLPLLDGISMKVITDPQALLAQLQGKALDLIVNPPFEQVGPIQQDKSLALLQSQTGAQMFYVGLNVTTPPLDKKEVRQAISYAIDRKRVVQTGLSGVGEPAAIPWPKFSPAYSEAKQNAYAFDLEKSKALLAQAGLPGGFDLPFVTTQGLPGLAKMAQIIQSDLAKVNIRAKIEEVESADLTTRLTERKFTHAWTLGYGFNNLHPSTMPSVAFPWRPGNNSSYYDTPAYTDLIQKLQVTTNPDDLKALSGQLTDLILDASFVLTVTPQRRMWATRADVKGVAWGQEDALFLERTSLER
jgi:peptide/nickel transport system substrate-binding protein